jgi:coenzyme F420-0:L-glutamate ligase / coenzyme F420-1:gamma-L-glutamate ligase
MAKEVKAAAPIKILADPRVSAFLSAARLGHLATADASGAPHNVPLCFWFDGARFYFVLDEKPKSRPGKQLKRMRNIAANPRVALVVDQYEEDWTHLAYVLVRGTAALVEDPQEYMLALRYLRDKYVQYRSMPLQPDKNAIVRIDPLHVHVWGARFQPPAA